ncbi:MAG TPA: protein kinase [Byssovorax sp.]|jgi:serine/threonine-protein kinase
MRVPYVAGDILAEKYLLESVLGGGAMGEVWLATNTALEVEVAIKLVRGTDPAAPPDDVRRSAAFERHLLHEAQATAKVCHPSVVRIFDYGVTDRGDPYIVMERLEGEDLRTNLVREGPMVAEEAVRLLLPVMQGMQAAHVLGVVHRDLKPENIFLAQIDEAVSPKVLDFGIADTSWVTDGLGAVVCGTPDYMAPEQITREPKPDHRADIWSLSALLFEAITAAVPRGPSRATAAWNELDPALAAILGKGLAFRPEDRWRSMTELGEVLAKWLVSRGVDSDCEGRSLRARWLYETPTARSDRPPPALWISSEPPAAEVRVVAPRGPGDPPFKLPMDRVASVIAAVGLICALGGGAFLGRGALASRYHDGWTRLRARASGPPAAELPQPAVAPPARPTSDAPPAPRVQVAPVADAPAASVDVDDVSARPLPPRSAPPAPRDTTDPYAEPPQRRGAHPASSARPYQPTEI